MEMENLDKQELLALIAKAEERITEIDREEAIREKSPVIVEVGKTYTARNGDRIIIVSKNISIYTGLNRSYSGKNIYEKHPEYYIDGRRSKTQLSDGDLIKEINNG